MRNEKQEKVEDIVAEMRNEWAEVYYSEGTRRRDGAYCDNKFVAIEPSEVADRIEAAANREREAGAEAAQICGEIGEMIGREATCEKSSQVGNAAAIREGKWMNGRRFEYEYAYCSECGHMQFAGWDTHKQAEENIESFACDYKFCPCCGAKMNGGVYVK